MAVVAYNGLAVIKAALRQVRRSAAIDDGASGYCLVHEMVRVAESLETLVEPRDWAVFQPPGNDGGLADRHGRARPVAQELQASARTQKPPVSRTYDSRRPRVSVARLSAQRQQAKEATTP